MKIHPLHGLKGTVSVPGDKSISHRSIMLGSIAEGTTEVHHFLQGADCLSSIACFRQMGIAIENNGDIVRVHGKGLHGLKRPEIFWTRETAERRPGLCPEFSPDSPLTVSSTVMPRFSPGR